MDGVTQAFLDFKEGLVRIVRNIVRNPVDIEDIIHEAYARSLEASSTQPISSPKAFLARAARNLAINHISRSAYKLNTSIEDIDSLPGYSHENPVEEQADSERRFYQFCQAVESLPLQCRKVFILKQVYGMTQKEISARLDISEKTVEYHLGKGLFKCRQYLRSAEPKRSVENASSTGGSVQERGQCPK